MTGRKHKIMAGLTEALAHARGEPTGARVTTHKVPLRRRTEAQTQMTLFTPDEKGIARMTITEELEMHAKDCEDAAKELMALAHAETTADSAEARAWLSMAHRIRHTAKRIHDHIARILDHS